nr:hypothetical protein BaRGS_002484 [Batillaria attramentaria]
MAVYWITESLPLACTALLPIVLFPVLGLQPMKDVCKNYMKDTSMFGIGCLTFAIAVETSNLHRRVALRTLLLMGSNPRWLMLGFMLPTWFLSMWVNNTSATAMMIPIVTAVLQQLKDTRIKRTPSMLAKQGMEVKQNKRTSASTSESRRLQPVATTGRKMVDNTDPDDNETDDLDPSSSSSVNNPAAYRRMCKGMSLCVAYAANIGGTGSVSGTSTNLIMQGQAQGLFQQYGLDSGVNFTTWMIFALPG